MADIPSIEPVEIVAGDTLKFTKSLSDYPASAGWTLTYYLVKTGMQIAFASTANGDDHLINVVNTTTASWAAGTYKYEAYIGKTGERYKVGAGTIEIKPNLAVQATGYDARTHVKKTLDALEAAMEGRASRTDLSYSIAGRNINQMSHEEIIKAHSHYKRLYQQELDAERISQGLSTGKKILTRFV